MAGKPASKKAAPTPSKTSRTTSTKTVSEKAQSTETKLVRELASILNETELTEIEIEKGTLRIRVAKGGTFINAAATVGQTMGQTMGQAGGISPALTEARVVETQALETPVVESKIDPAGHPGAVKSPMVGTAHIRPGPDADLFVSVGDKVQQGDTILTIEAMKTYNPIVAPKSGKVLSVLVENAQPVEFGEPLFIIV